MAFYQFRPALRLVSSGGTVTAGPLQLAVSVASSNGIWLASTRCEYVPELLGPWVNLAYSQRFNLLGYRPKIELKFEVLVADGASAVSNLYQYYVGAFTGGSFAALQFNLFNGTSTTWRGVIPTSTWDLRPARGKQRIGYELDLTLEGRDLITAPGDWTAGTW